MGESERFPTPSTPNAYVTLLKKTVREKYAHQSVECIVVAFPSSIKHGVATWAPNLGWSDFAIEKALTDLLPGVPVLIENDANLAGLAETRALNPVPVSALYITISTGIGSGVITNGRIDPGLRCSEAGLALVEYDGRVQQWEDFASGRAIVKVYKKIARDIKSERTWRQIADRISRGFLAVIPMIQPDVIIIGGGVGSHFSHYAGYLENTLREHLPPHITCPKIVQAKHPEEAVLYGCYHYGNDYLTDSPSKK